MADILDILITFDGEAIANESKGGTPTSPIFVNPSNKIYMMTRYKDVISGNTGAELRIRAQVGDSIRWRCTTVSRQAEYGVVLYDFVATSGSNLIQVGDKPLPFKLKAIQPNKSDPSHPTTQIITDYVWQGNALEAGSVTYHWRYVVVDRDEKVVGYYYWDPFVTIEA